MKKKSMIIAAAMLLGAAFTANAQVTIGSDTPPNATLEVVATKTDGSTAEGVIVPRLTKEQINLAQAKYGLEQTGAVVYVTDYSALPVTGYSDQIGCEGFAYWNGTHWVMDCNITTYVRIGEQPKAFSFYETGTESVEPLVFVASGSSELSYQWYKVTGNNVHVRIAEVCSSVDGTGYNTPSFTPTAVIKGSTKISANTGFYRYYCVATNQTGDEATSDVSEVAVGCGAKNLDGEWISFMCFNLGATEHTIDGQKNYPLTPSHANDADGRHYYIAGEENVYGDLYQWGRIGDGHEKRGTAQGFTPGANTAGTNQIPYGTDPVYEDGNLIGPSQRYPWRQVARTDAAHYGMFITALGLAQGYNWAYSLSDNQIDQLWRSGRFAPNDPCAKIKADGLTYETYYPATNGPAGATTGWRTPAQDEWGDLFRGGTVSGSPSIAMANTWTWNGQGYEIKPDGVTTTLFLPANGFRSHNNGMLYLQGTTGYYWSTSIVGTNSYGLNFNTGSVSPAISYDRAYGFALRCVKD